MDITRYIPFWPGKKGRAGARGAVDAGAGDRRPAASGTPIGTRGLVKHCGFYLPADAHVTATKHPVEGHEHLYGAIIGAVRGVLRFTGSPILVYGHEKIPLTGGAVLAGNHTGYLDFVFVGAPPFLRGRRLVRYLAKKEVFDASSLLSRVLRSMNHIAVDREAGRAALDEAVEQCLDGHLVGIFPEGTISRTFNLRELKSGATRIAQTSNVPLIPVAVWGSQRLWTKDHPRDMGRKKHPVIVRVGDPVPTEGIPEEIALTLHDRLSELIDQSRAEYVQRFGAIPDGEWWMPADLGGGAPDLERATLLDMAQAERRAARRAAREAKKAQKAEKANSAGPLRKLLDAVKLSRARAPKNTDEE